MSSISNKQQRKRASNNNKRKRNSNNVAKIYKQASSVFGIPVTRMLTSADTISSVNGSTNLTITPSGGTYINLSNYVTSSDWSAIYSGYQLFRIKEIKVVVSRLLSETALTTVYPSGLANLHVAFYPINASYFPSNSFIVQSDASLRISPFTPQQYTKIFKLPNMLSTRTVGGVDYTTNPSQWTSTNMLPYINGCFCIGAVSPGNASSTTPIFAFETYAIFEFCCPY